MRIYFLALLVFNMSFAVDIPANTIEKNFSASYYRDRVLSTFDKDIIDFCILHPQDQKTIIIERYLQAVSHAAVSYSNLESAIAYTPTDSLAYNYIMTGESQVGRIGLCVICKHLWDESFEKIKEEIRYIR